MAVPTPIPAFSLLPLLLLGCGLILVLVGLSVAPALIERSPGGIRARRPARTRPPRGHPAGERRTRRRRDRGTHPRSPSGAAPWRRLVPRRLAADRAALSLARRRNALADRLSGTGRGLCRDGDPFGSRTLRTRRGSSRRSTCISGRDRATRPGREALAAHRRYERLVGAFASRRRAR